ncbi:hypothetical protein [Piscirickettsia litoralis]|uniref:Uncharacterized protein n=1 Tax=Piscirickettsia litoralis TaxID=1891921 RepID=A0ABX3A8D7_9GAMM|nr:hypothetical protein [Piscirickettsia litoralis]ODN43913.1 hypothetical protein BGC07_14750 [Piscirickettsia litoralis]
MDADGIKHDVMENLKRTKIFESLPIDYLLVSEMFHSAKVLMLALFVRYLNHAELEQVTDSMERLIALFEKEKIVIRD